MAGLGGMAQQELGDGRSHGGDESHVVVVWMADLAKSMG
jgi:hypothetical protein